MSGIRDWFEQLAPRERLLVLLAAGLAVVALIVLGGVQPLLTQSKKSHAAVTDKRELLGELRAVASRLGPQTGAAATVATGDESRSLVLVIDQSTRSSGLASYLKRNQPDGDGSIRLRFENVPFDALVTWLSDLQNQQGLRVANANIDAAATTGRVNCNLTLSRQGG